MKFSQIYQILLGLRSMKGESKKERRLSDEERREKEKVTKLIIDDRRFMTTMSDDEFLEYEHNRTKLGRNIIKKIMVKYGYFRNKNVKTRSCLDVNMDAHTYLQINYRRQMI